MDALKVQPKNHDTWMSRGTIIQNSENTGQFLRCYWIATYHTEKKKKKKKKEKEITYSWIERQRKIMSGCVTHSMDRNVSGGKIDSRMLPFCDTCKSCLMLMLMLMLMRLWKVYMDIHAALAMFQLQPS